MRPLPFFPFLFTVVLLVSGCDTNDPIDNGLDTQPDLDCSSDEAIRIYTPPKATYLRVSDLDHDAGAESSVPVRLADLGIQAGDQLQLERLGEFQYYGGNVNSVYYGLLVVFSETSELLGYSERYRVPGALAAGIPHETRVTFGTEEPTDIPEDFVVGMEPNGDPRIPVDEPVVVEVPEGAEWMFLSPDDDFFHDNLDLDEDFALCVKVLQ